MDAFFRIVVFIVVVSVLLFVVVGVAGFMYGKGTSIDTSELANNPCIPVLSNGKTNPHYREMLWNCSVFCSSDKRATVNIKTCACECNDIHK